MAKPGRDMVNLLVLRSSLGFYIRHHLYQYTYNNNSDNSIYHFIVNNNNNNNNNSNHLMNNNKNCNRMLVS